MKPEAQGLSGRASSVAWLIGGVVLWLVGSGLWAAEGPKTPVATVESVKGTVQFAPAGSPNWYGVTTNQVLYPGDQLRTAERSRATLRLQDLSILPIDELSTIRLQERPQGIGLLLLRGVLSFFHRDRPGEIEVRGGGVSATIRGTEFVFKVDADGSARLTLFDGLVDMTNDFGGLVLQSGDIAIARPGQPPRKTAVLVSGDVSAIQWALYYPAILDLRELGWNTPPEEALRPSVEAYQAGNLPRALANYPPGRMPARPDERVFLAALLLSVGNVEEAAHWLEAAGSQEPIGRLAAAQLQLIAAVQGRPCQPDHPGGAAEERLATEWLARAYCLQAQRRLDEALASARQATERAPHFGFAWARVAELEFSFGRVAQTARALEHALTLTPENAEALSLMGFMEAARNRVSEAAGWFERALAVDGALGNAWLGRGLVRIRQGDLARGRADLEIAAAIEPQRSLLRSYLAKAFLDEDRLALAGRELALAEKLDPRDPTSWLYRSLLDRRQNQVNSAVRDLSRVQELTGQRGLYRSGLLLDQDRAVAAANQALAFRDAGMLETAVQSAGRSVTADYANASAHQFLADSYASADRIELRHETPRVSEYLLANLLAPVGSGILSASLSQQEYSKLFERDGFGLFSETTYRSRGAWTENGGARGTFGNMSFLAEAFYDADPGYYANNDLDQQVYGVQFKEQVGARDTFYVQALYSDLHSGDLAHYYDPLTLDPDLRIRERLNPLVLAGWHRQWSPESHSVFLAGLVQDTQEIGDPTQPVLALEIDPTSASSSLFPLHIAQRYRAETTILTAEAQQIWQGLRHTVVGGMRYQHGEFDVNNEHGANDTYNPIVLPPDSTHVQPGMERVQAYGYDTWHVLPTLHLVGGLSFDYLEYPVNSRYAPVTSREDSKTHLSPKAGLLWEITPRLNFRAAYTRSLGGVSFDQSFRLEPTQVAGFNQAYRSLIPESVGGVSAGAEFETAHASLEARVWTNTWVSVGGERLTSQVDREVGIYAGDPNTALIPTQIGEHLDFEEDSLQVNLDHLVGRYLSLGAHYRLSWARLEETFPSSASPLDARIETEALLHTLRLSANLNLPCGVFATAEGVWFGQHNADTQSLPDDDFWQLNLVAGFRFARRHAEIALGILNVTDQDYRLNPVNLYVAPERERTFFARLRWAF